MLKNDVTAYVFVGSDRSQLLAVKVLEHSIRRHTTMDVKVRSMDDLNLPDPKDVRQGKRTGFSFTRFAIPQLMGYQGRAVYLDADMLVFRDFRELWNIPFDGAKIVIQEELPDTAQHYGKIAGKKRVKQCSVMLLDCENLKWDPLKIIAGLDGQYTYEELLSDMCILEESEIKYGIPFEWNSLETYQRGKTGLIHYTDMHTQPWVYPGNPNGYVWFEEVRLMLKNGLLTWAEVEKEVELGYFRPSLVTELKDAGREPVKPATPEQIARYEAIDRQAGYIKHKAVYEAKKARSAAIKEYEARIAREKGGAAIAVHVASSTGSTLRRAVTSLKQRFIG